MYPCCQLTDLNFDDGKKKVIHSKRGNRLIKIYLLTVTKYYLGVPSFLLCSVIIESQFEFCIHPGSSSKATCPRLGR